MGYYRVCPRCDGEGVHTNPSIDGNGITASEMQELGPEFFEDYMGGVYDVTCEECGGKRVVSDEDHQDYLERKAEHRTMLREMGIYDHG